MKKFSKMLSLLMAVLMIAAIQLPAMAAELGAEVTESIPTLQNLTKNNCTALGTSSQTLNSSQMIAENDNYIFVAIGMKGLNFRVCSAVQVFDKATGNLLTTITQATGNAVWYAPLIDMYVDGDMLYIQWGNAVNSVTATAQRPVVNGLTESSPLVAYNVANVASGATLPGVKVASGNAFANTDLPYTQGGLSYLDEENGVLYTSLVGANAATNLTRYYYLYETASIESGNVPAQSTVNTIFTYGLESINATQFIVKDGWLFEVIKNKAGMTEYATNTLATNNQVRVYDLTGVTPVVKPTNVTSNLKGVYTTNVAGDNAIRDIEVVGDYMYVATEAGIEVVSLAPAKAAGASASTVLTATIVEETGIGGAADLDAIGSSLFAAYTGPEYFAPAGNAYSAAGALVVYDIATNPAVPAKTGEQSVKWGLAEIAANADDGVVYVLGDVYGPPFMTAYTFVPDVIVEEEEFEFTAIKLNGNTTLTAGTFDISVELTNPDVVMGTVICAVYEGDKLVNVFVNEDYAGETSVTMAEDYVVSGTVTEIKAMFLDSLTGELRPLIPAISISK